MPNIIILQEVTSTSDFLKHTAATADTGTMICAFRQTAGRGQKGNSWEAEPGKNATFSILLKNPKVAVKKQFALSEAVSLAIVDVLEQYATGFKIKWPNDVYYGDRKISGILIENSLAGDAIDYTVAGVGVNINQQLFTSDAPNPVSLTQITGEFYDLMAMLEQLGEKIEHYCDFDGSTKQLKALHERYLAHLYRNDGEPHPFVLPDGTRFDATIDDVALDGTLKLRHSSNGKVRNYRFKEVGFVINKVKFL